MPESAVESVEAVTLAPKVSTGVNGLSLICGIAAISILLLICARAGVTDLVGFLVGAKLLGTKDLYSVAANLATQPFVAGNGWQSDGVIFVRPPFFALMMKPLLWLPFVQAVFLWRLLMTGALVAATWLLPGVPTQWKVGALCCSVPAYAAIAFAGDGPMVLLFVALSLFLWGRGSGVLAGIMLSLCLAKFHYLIFLPLLLWRREFRRALIGFATTMCALVTINFLAQPDWMRLYWQALRLPQPNMNAKPDTMPNFYATFFWTGHPEVFVWIGAVIVAVLLWPICRKCTFEIGISCCFLGALVAAPHSNAIDGILAIPALLLGAQRTYRLHSVSMFLLSPLVDFAYCAWPTYGPALFVAGALWLLRCISSTPCNISQQRQSSRQCWPPLS